MFWTLNSLLNRQSASAQSCCGCNSQPRRTCSRKFLCFLQHRVQLWIHMKKENIFKSDFIDNLPTSSFFHTCSESAGWIVLIIIIIIIFNTALVFNHYEEANKEICSLECAHSRKTSPINVCFLSLHTCVTYMCLLYVRVDILCFMKMYVCAYFVHVLSSICRMDA